jgi:hypothetical protein
LAAKLIVVEHSIGEFHTLRSRMENLIYFSDFFFVKTSAREKVSGPFNLYVK